MNLPNRSKAAIKRDKGALLIAQKHIRSLEKQIQESQLLERDEDASCIIKPLDLPKQSSSE